MVLDDLGALAEQLRERVRVRRETAEKAEAESAAWLHRLAQVSREDDPRWVVEVDERKVARAADDAVLATPFGGASEAAASAAETVEALQRKILELLQANQELTKGLAAMRGELVDLRTRNDALVTQLAALRLPQQRRVSAAPSEGVFLRPAGAAQPRPRVVSGERVSDAVAAPSLDGAASAHAAAAMLQPEGRPA